MDKLALSEETILSAAKKSKKWMKKNTGSPYKPKSFAERDQLMKVWHRKFRQREYLNEVAKTLTKDKNLVDKLSKILKVRFA